MGPRRNYKSQGHASRCCWLLVVVVVADVAVVPVAVVVVGWRLSVCLFCMLFFVVGVGGCSTHSVPNRPQIGPGTLQNGSQGPQEGQNYAQGLPGGHLEAQVAPRWAPEVPKRRSRDSSRRPSGSPRDLFGSILGAKIGPASDVGDLWNFSPRLSGSLDFGAGGVA